MPTPGDHLGRWYIDHDGLHAGGLHDAGLGRLLLHRREPQHRRPARVAGQQQLHGLPERRKWPISAADSLCANVLCRHWYTQLVLIIFPKCLSNANEHSTTTGGLKDLTHRQTVCGQTPSSGLEPTESGRMNRHLPGEDVVLNVESVSIHRCRVMATWCHRFSPSNLTDWIRNYFWHHHF